MAASPSIVPLVSEKLFFQHTSFTSADQVNRKVYISAQPRGNSVERRGGNLWKQHCAWVHVSGESVHGLCSSNLLLLTVLNHCSFPEFYWVARRIRSIEVDTSWPLNCGRADDVRWRAQFSQRDWESPLKLLKMSHMASAQTTVSCSIEHRTCHKTSPQKHSKNYTFPILWLQIVNIVIT